jgi:ParB-like chromosome segregation protein Spo0J
MKLEQLPLNELTPDPNNARTHDETNLKAIEGSLREFGQRKPIVIDQQGVVVAGNGTVEAARRLGWSEIQAVRIPADWSADRIKAFALADNRTAELAEWDAQILADQLLELDSVGYELATFGFETLQPPTESDLEDAFANLNKEESDLEQITFTLHKDQAQLIRAALDASKALGEYGETGNQNSNGNAIARVCELWLGTQL